MKKISSDFFSVFTNHIIISIIMQIILARVIAAAVINGVMVFILLLLNGSLGFLLYRKWKVNIGRFPPQLFELNPLGVLTITRSKAPIIIKIIEIINSESFKLIFFTLDVNTASRKMAITQRIVKQRYLINILRRVFFIKTSLDNEFL